MYCFATSFAFVRDDINKSSQNKYYIRIVGKYRDKKYNNIFKGIVETELSVNQGELRYM